MEKLKEIISLFGQYYVSSEIVVSYVEIDAHVMAWTNFFQTFINSSIFWFIFNIFNLHDTLHLHDNLHHKETGLVYLFTVKD